MPSLFFSYSHADEALRDQLERVITTWHDRRIGAGEELDPAIASHVERDDIILLLVSPDFLASDYCYDREMMRAMERHDAGEAIVIPAILRACHWHGAPFGKLLATPPDGRPVTQWPDRDQAFLEVVKAIQGAAARLSVGAPSAPWTPAREATASSSPPAPEAGPRSSNLRLAKSFTQRDKDVFLNETFEYIARFFQNSLDELGARNPGVEGAYRAIDANRFTATIYRNGDAVSRCTVFQSGETFGKGIGYSTSDNGATNSFNEHLRVEVDDQSMYLQSMGMAFHRGRDREEKLSQEGAAELLWSLLIEPLQRQGR